MFKVLLKSRLASLGAWFSGSTRTKTGSTTGKKILFSLLMLYAFGCVAFLMFGAFSEMAGPFSSAGLSWVYFAMFGLMDMSLMVVGSVFMAKSQLYEAKDNEILLSMPVPPGAILASRMAMLLVVNFALSLLVSGPALVAWCMHSVIPATTAQIVVYVVIALLLPFVSLALSCLLAWIISSITNRMRNRTMIDTILSLAFLLAYLYFCTKLNTMVTALAASGSTLAGSLGSVAPVYWLGAAVADTNWLYFAYTVAICVVPFVLAYLLLSATFIKTATMKKGFAKVKYVDKGQKVSSVSSALFGRELSRFLSSSSYIINAGIGPVFMAVAAVLAVIKKNAIMAFLAQVPGFAAILAPLALLGLCLLEGMTTISAPSVSIEGKNLWIIQSMPVAPQEALRAKLKLHLRFLVPATVLCIAAVIIVTKPAGAMLACAVVLPLAFAVFTAVLGLMANLRHPFLEWTSETQAVKSGISVMIAIFGCWGVVIIPAVLLFAVVAIPAWIVMTAFTVIILVVSWLMYNWIMTRGAKIYSEL